ncbi:MAG: hypothetical protein M1514_03145 [Patescibacteria group bacterium]|nr:hypothetical protein [Patescibacteria group bacterium]
MNEEKKVSNFQLTKLPKKAFEVIVTIPWEEIKETQDKVLKEAKESLEIKGFRKGKAPEKLVAEAIGSQKLLELTLDKILPLYYEKAIGELNLKPIMMPRASLVSAKENEDWQVKFTSCEEPEVNLNNYKEELRKLKAVGSIWTPDKGKKEEKPVEKKEDREEKINRSLTWLLQNAKPEICDLLLENEINHKLSGLLEQTQKLGITVDQYLASTGKTIDQIKEEYHQRAEENIALELILNKIADTEKIEVEPAEIEKAMAAAKTPEEKKALEEQKYWLASILRRQKTLDFLANLV